MNIEKKSAERNYGLDLLKIMGIVCIFFLHYQQVTEVIFPDINFCFGRFNYGYIVELFFVISGFFVCAYEDKIKKGLTFRDFFAKRYLRLIPLVAISAIVFNLVNAFYRSVFMVNWYGASITLWKTIQTAVGLTEGWGIPESIVNYPMWYVSVLLLCYCVFYLMNYIAKRLDLSVNYLYVFMIFVGIGGLTYGLNYAFLNGVTFRGYYSFFFGILLKKFIDSRELTNKMIIVALLVSIAIPYLLVHNTEYVSDGANYIMTFLHYPSLIILMHTKLAKKLFNVKLIGVLSEISFNVYVWHMLVIIFMIAGNYKWNWGFDYYNRMTMIIWLLVSFAIGTISHFAIEKPMNRYLQKRGK